MCQHGGRCGEFPPRQGVEMTRQTAVKDGARTKQIIPCDEAGCQGVMRANQMKDRLQPFRCLSHHPPLVPSCFASHIMTEKCLRKNEEILF